MICTKCNNEIPAGAKFCPSCGAAAAAPEAEKKLYCEKCGLELMKGTKFCSVCGGNGIARESGKPAEAMAAVDLGKPSESDSLVSAMNSANAVPTPSNSVPMPSGNIPMPVNGSSGIAAPSGVSGFGSAPDPVIPAYVASVSADAGQDPVMPMPTASGEAVAAVKKKANGGKIALFSVLGVLAAAIAVTLVMFFTNRAAFLSTLMGKEKYATMVEGNSIKNVTDKLDIPAISNGIKTASGAMQSLYAAYGAEMLDDMSGISGLSRSTAPMSYTSGSDGGFDLESFSKEFAALLSDTYGVNSISETLSVNVELSDSVKSMIESNMYYDVDLNEILGIVNGTSLNYTLTAKDNKAAVTMGTQGKIVVNAKLMVDGQDAYIALPFASDKAIKVSVPKGSGSEQLKLDVTPLELDEKELERLITECVEIYLDYYKNSAIEMENGELKAGGVTVEGKVITAEFKGEKLSKMFTDIAKHIVKDDYFMTAITDYANSLGAEITKQEFVDEALEDIENSMDADDDDKLIITTVIDRNGEVLGKSFKAMYEDDVLCEISYAVNGDQIGFEVDDPDYDELSNTKVTITKKDDENGTCKVKFTADGNEISLVIDYSDCKTAEFCGNKIPTGKISVGMALPEDFADQLGKENFAAVNGAKLDIAITADSANTVSYSIGVDVPNYGSVSFKDVVTAMNDESELKIPSNVIDVTGALNGDITPGDDTYNQIMAFGSEIAEAVKKALPEFISDELDYVLPGSGSTDSKADEGDIEYLLEDIMDDMAKLNEAMNSSSDEDLNSKRKELFSEYMELYTSVSAKKHKMALYEFYSFEHQYDYLYNELINLGVVSSGISYGNLLAEQVEAKLEKIGDKFADVYSEYSSMSGNAAAQSAFADIMRAFEELSSYCMELGVDEIADCTDEQLKKIDTLLDALDSKIVNFKVQSSN